MKDNKNYKPFNNGEEEDKIKKFKSKSDETLKYRIALILFILLCALFLLMLFKLYRMKKLDKVFIKLLIVSDMHDDVESLDRLIKKVKSTRYNYVLYLGDFVNMIQGQQNSSQFADKYQKRIKQYLNKLEKIASVFYIPGNDDHSTMHVLNSPTFTKTSININNRYIKLRDNLYIMGLGGSVPILNGGKYDKNTIPFSKLNTSDIFQKGYPYYLPEFKLDNYKESDKMFGDKIRYLIKKVKDNALDNPYQSILLTHNGPFYSRTNIQQELGTG